MDESEIKSELLLEGDRIAFRNDKNSTDFLNNHDTAIDKTLQEADNIQQDNDSSQRGTDNSQRGTHNAQHGTDNSQRGIDNVQVSSDTQQETEAPVKVRKRPRLEIELDFKLEEEFDSIADGRNVLTYKPRERRSVVKYQEPLKMEEKKKKILVRDKKNRIKYEDGEEEFICETCNVPFMTIQALIAHRKKHFKAIKFECALCTEVFDTNPELIKHKIVHKDEDRTFLCMKCETAFTNHLDYLKHKMTHQHVQAYKCIECGREYNHRTGYLIHLETHYDPMIECEVCHGMFKAYKIKIHMKTHSGITGGVKCVECGKICVDTKTYKYHMISHTGVKLFQCLYCGKGFSNSQQRKVHTRTHTDERPYECNVCHYKCRQHGDLKRHMSSHQIEKPFKCDVCNKKFSHKETLSYHMDMHNNTQKYECTICNKRVHTKTGLKDHVLRFHSKEKRFKCEPCGVSFTVENDLRKHCRFKKHMNNVFGFNIKNNTGVVKLKGKFDQ